MSGPTDPALRALERKSKEVIAGHRNTTAGCSECGMLWPCHAVLLARDIAALAAEAAPLDPDDGDDWADDDQCPKCGKPWTAETAPLDVDERRLWAKATEQMATELHANHGKHPWTEYPGDFLMSELRYHVDKLAKSGSWEHAADVANLAAMFADALQSPDTETER